MLFKNNTTFAKYSLVTFLSLLVLAACRNEDGEKEFVAAVDVAKKGVQSIEIQAGKQGSVLEANANSQFTVLATLADNSQEDVSSSVTWSSSDASILTVSVNGLVSAKGVDGTANVQVSWSYLTDSLPVQVSTAALNGLSFTNLAATLPECKPDTELSVEGSYDDGRTSDVSALVSSWTSSDATVAKVSGVGLLDTLNSGNTILSASYGGQTATQAISVSDSLTALSLEPSSDFSLETGASQSLVVKATDATETRVVTGIADFTVGSSVITVDANGLATAGDRTGNTTVSAGCGGLTTSAITVSVVQAKTVSELVIRYDNSGTSPAGPFEVADSPIQLRAFLRYSDGSEIDVTDSQFTDWSVRSTISGTGATVDNSGSDMGEVSFNQTGRTEIEVVYDDDDNNVYKEDAIDVLVE